MNAKSVPGVLLAAGLLAAGRPASCGYAGAGEAFELELPDSALSLVAGSATPGLSRDAIAVRGNPARIGEAGHSAAAATYALLPGGLTNSQLSACLPVGGAGAFGASLQLVRIAMPITLEDGAGAFGGTGGDVVLQTVFGTIGWAPDLSVIAEDLGTAMRAGVSLTYLSREIDDVPAGGAGGAAAVWVPLRGGFAGYGMVRNVGWTGSTEWPLAATAGIALERDDALTSGTALRASLAGSWSRERGGTGAVAVEYGFSGESLGAALRAGWEAGSVRSIASWPAGGLVVRVAGLSVEAGVGSLGGLGLEKVVTLSYREAVDSH